VVSHEPWMSCEIASKPNGGAVTCEEEKSFLIYRMPYSLVRSFDCGLRIHPRFLSQKKVAAFKPSLEMVVDSVRAYCLRTGRGMPQFNIEIKSRVGGDGIYHPRVDSFASIVLSEVYRLGIGREAMIQSFDVRALEAVRRFDKQIRVVYLVEEKGSLTSKLALLSFVPDVYSPGFALLTQQMVVDCHAKGIKVIPWTVNEVSDMKRLVTWGVDGIITDFPDRKF
jgi:glycerophosphoryl diester phosphodiesterase